MASVSTVNTLEKSAKDWVEQKQLKQPLTSEKRVLFQKISKGRGKWSISFDKTTVVAHQTKKSADILEWFQWRSIKYSSDFSGSTRRPSDEITCPKSTGDWKTSAYSSINEVKLRQEDDQSWWGNFHRVKIQTKKVRNGIRLGKTTKGGKIDMSLGRNRITQLMCCPELSHYTNFLTAWKDYLLCSLFFHCVLKLMSKKICSLSLQWKKSWGNLISELYLSRVYYCRYVHYFRKLIYELLLSIL